MRVLFATSEAFPFAMSGGLADVMGALPKALRNRLVGARVILPLYSSIKPEFREKMTFIQSFTVPVAWRNQYCGLFEYKLGKVVYYFIDNEYYFKRDGLYGYYDDAERFTFFSRAVLESLKFIDFKPDVIHCNDWQTALVPVYKTLVYNNDEYYDSIKTLFTIHNIAYQGHYGTEVLSDILGLPEGTEHYVEYNGDVNFMKGAIECADKVNTVSRTYAEEIMTPWFSHSLDTILKQREWKVSGIINGIDTDVYNPETDKDIYKNYSASTLKDKEFNKKKLLEEFGLIYKKDVPVVGMVTRLVAHKGIDLVRCVMEDILREDVQFVILGSGDWEYETFFHEMVSKYPDKVAFWAGFRPDLAHKIYAGADMFLMPSRSEPCGLAQMVALRYGTIPVVRETGGLKDTVIDSGLGEGNGFTFPDFNAHAMSHAVWRGIEGYRNKKGWEMLVKRAMSYDYSWGNSAKEYIKLYKSL